MGQILDSYIIRIVRRRTDSRSEYPLLDGAVESPEGNARLPFHNAKELWFILGNFTTPKQQAPATNKKGRG